MSIQEIRNAAAARMLELLREIEPLRIPGFRAWWTRSILRSEGTFGTQTQMPYEVCNLVAEYIGSEVREQSQQLAEAERELRDVKALYDRTLLLAEAERELLDVKALYDRILLLAKAERELRDVKALYLTKKLLLFKRSSSNSNRFQF